MLDAVDEVEAEVLGLGGGREVGELAVDLAQGHGDLAARQVGAEAGVRAGGAEAPWSLGVRVMSKRCGSSNTSSSRLADQYQSTTAARVTSIPGRVVARATA